MPARPRGLLEPCAATSGTHGSEEGGAGKRRPLSDNKVHWVRDVVWNEDKSLIRTGNAPQVMSAITNLVISLFRIQGVTRYTEQTRRNAQNPRRALQLLGLSPG